MGYHNELGIQELYNVAAKYTYQEHRFSTVRRDFVLNPLLVKPQHEFKLDTTWYKHPESNRDAVGGEF